jgi:hypothetical protein
MDGMDNGVSPPPTPDAFPLIPGTKFDLTCGGGGGGGRPLKKFTCWSISGVMGAMDWFMSVSIRPVPLPPPAEPPTVVDGTGDGGKGIEVEFVVMDEAEADVMRRS